jgi:hypothetical protein
MGQMVVMVPNTLHRALYAIDVLSGEGAIRAADGRVLKSLYVLGWQDGFVAAPIRRLAGRVGMGEKELTRAIAALHDIQVISLRALPDGEVSVELLVLSRPWEWGDVKLGWWQQYVVDDAADESDNE